MRLSEATEPVGWTAELRNLSVSQLHFIHLLLRFHVFDPAPLQLSSGQAPEQEVKTIEESIRLNCK